MGSGQRFTHDRLVHVVDLPKPESRDELAAFAKRPPLTSRARTAPPTRLPRDEGRRPSPASMMLFPVSSAQKPPVARGSFLDS
jgi:hypothetical protein